MSNYTPETAIDMGTFLPYTNTQDLATDVLLSPTAGGFVSTCDSLHYHPVWYKYTTKANEYYIAIGADAPGAAFYSPIGSIWTGTPPALTQYQINSIGNNQPFCSNLGGGFYFQIPVQPMTTYYFQFTAANNVADTGNLVVSGYLLPTTVAFPVSSLIIPDDSDEFPAVVINTSTAQIQRFIVGFPAGESAAYAGNFLCCQDGETDTGIAILDSSYVRSASLDFAPDNVVAVKTEGTFFYVATIGVGPSFTVTLRKITTAGSQIHTWTLPANAGTGIYAINSAASILYYCKRTSGEAVHRYDLLGSAPLSDLHAGFTTEIPWSFADGFCDASDNIVVGYRPNATITGAIIRRFDPSGTVLNTYTLNADVTHMNHYDKDVDGLSMWVWGYQGSGDINARFQQIRLSDGAVLQTIGPFQVEGTSGGPSNLINGGISNSCPLLVAAFAPAGVTGTLTVGKLTYPTDDLTEFEIVVGDGTVPPLDDM